MRNKDSIKKLSVISQCGSITTKQVTEAGLHREILCELVEKGKAYRFRRGIYVFNDAWEDDFYLLQKKYKRGIYSHNTSLYLLGYSDRTPAKYNMTFPKGYNSQSLKQENITVKRVVKENYSLGIIELSSPCNNIIRAYNIERTLCDILRGKGSDIQIIIPAIKKYVASKEKDIYILLQYAEQLHVKSKILRYLEVLL